MILLLLVVQTNCGYINVQADQDSLPVFVDNEFIGKTPVLKYPLLPDEYNIGFFPQDSVEEASWRLKDGNISALWKIAKYSEGIVKVKINPNAITTIKLNYEKVKKAPSKAKLKIIGCLGGVFVLGILTTLAVQAIF